MDCLFCNIAAGTIDSDVLYRDQEIMAFRDINPQAPQHVLVIPLKHIATLNDLTSHDANLTGKIILAAKDLASQLGIADTGYRTVFNCLNHGGQEVYHIHCHLLGGRQMNWPPG